MNPARILLVHPEPSILALMASMLQSSGFQIDEANDERAAARRLERGGVDLILAGADPSDPDSLELLSLCRRKYPRVPFLLLFPGHFPDRAREAIRMGAVSVLRFPLPANELRAAVTQACDPQSGPFAAASAPANGTSARANGEHRPAPDAGPKPPAASRADGAPARQATEPIDAAFAPTMFGDDPALRQSIELAATVATTRASVVIVGEQGTGKSLLARAIHQRSGRRDQPFLEIACSGGDEFLLERDLFGQKFEGAEATERPGFLERANRGTILFDEIAALSLPLQDRLIAVLRDGEYAPMGSSRSLPVDVRFLFATRENLPALVEQGKFRRELHDRISDVCLKLPPLRQRGKDVLRIAEMFRERFSREYGKTAVEFAPEALDSIARHDWPGNVRELESVIQRWVALSQGPRIAPGHLASGSLPPRTARSAAYAPRQGLQSNLGLRPLKQALEEPEKQIIIQTLRALNWNRQDTARVLDINRTTLYKKMKKYGLLMEEPALLN